jgi:hypothetical protein
MKDEPKVEFQIRNMLNLFSLKRSMTEKRLENILK